MRNPEQDVFETTLLWAKASGGYESGEYRIRRVEGMMGVGWYVYHNDHQIAQQATYRAAKVAVELHSEGHDPVVRFWNVPKGRTSALTVPKWATP